jgi:hypothetical protein
MKIFDMKAVLRGGRHLVVIDARRAAGPAGSLQQPPPAVAIDQAIGPLLVSKGDRSRHLAVLPVASCRAGCVNN